MKIVYVTGTAFPIEFYWRYPYLKYPPVDSNSDFFKNSSNIKSEPIYRRNDYMIPFFREDGKFWIDSIGTAFFLFQKDFDNIDKKIIEQLLFKMQVKDYMIMLIIYQIEIYIMDNKTYQQK